MKFKFSLALVLLFTSFMTSAQETVLFDESYDSAENEEFKIEKKLEQQVEEEIQNDTEISLDDEKNRDDEEDKYLLDGIATPEHYKLKKGNVYLLTRAEDLNLQNNFFDIPVVYNKRVKKWIHYYCNKGRKFFELHISRAGRYAPLIGSLLEERGLPRDLIFLAMAESGFNNRAHSIASAVGPWQFMPSTGKMYNLKQNWYVDERRDPIKATVAAANYLSKLYGDFGSWKIAMAAYNAGEGKLGRAIKKYNSTDLWDLSKGNYLKSETKNYVPKIMALAIISKNLKTFGFNDIDFRTPLDFDEVTVPAGTDIIKIAEKLNIELEEIRTLNPELLRWFTPLNDNEYKLRLPPKSGENFKNCCANMNLSANDFQKYKIDRSNMKLSTVAQKFRISSPAVISKLNNVSEKHTFKKGDTVILPFRSEHKVTKSNIFYADLFSRQKRRNFLRKFHIIRKGDSLHSLAKKYKISLKKLLAANSSLKQKGKLLVGRKLVIR